MCWASVVHDAHTASCGYDIIEAPNFDKLFKLCLKAAVK